MRAFTPRRVLLAATTLLLLTPLTFTSPASAAPPTPKVTYNGANPFVAGSELTVTVTPTLRSQRITISWGDNTAKTSTRGACTSATAKTTPSSCPTVAQHTYAKEGTYTIEVKAGSTVISRVAIAAQPNPSTPTTQPSSLTLPNDWQNVMLAQVNTLQASLNLNPLTLCPSLQTAAQKHATDMATNNYYSHTSLDGRSPTQRASAEGYPGGVGENTAVRHTIIEGAMQEWMIPSANYANLISPYYTYAGFGIANNPNSTYRIYWTQSFGTGKTC